MLRRDEEYVGKRVMEVPGKSWRGRPKRRWLECTGDDLSKRKLPGDEAQDRTKLTKHRPYIQIMIIRRNYDVFG